MGGMRRIGVGAAGQIVEAAAVYVGGMRRIGVGAARQSGRCWKLLLFMWEG